MGKPPEGFARIFEAGALSIDIKVAEGTVFNFRVAVSPDEDEMDAEWIRTMRRLMNAKPYEGRVTIKNGIHTIEEMRREHNSEGSPDA